MTITKTRNADNLVLTLNGRLDSITASALEEEIGVDLSGVKELILDFSSLEYISSAGLRVLLKAQKMMSGHGEMKLTNVNEMVMEVFDITGFSDILTIC